MRFSLILLKHVAKAYLNLYGGGVAGEIVFGIAEDVMKSWQLEKDERHRKAELEGIAQATTSEVEEAVAEVVGTVARDRTVAEKNALSAYLMQVPASIRRTLRRATDPTGKTVPSGFPLKTAADLATILPDRLPRFRPGDCPLAGVDRELVELLGIGGFGEVWKAINPNRPSKPPVALKFCLDDAARDRLLRHEARLLDRVMQVGVHPGIVSLRETYLKADPPCLEYEYVDGGELTGLIREFHAKGGISAQGAAKIVERLARTVGYFHRLDPPIVHRDLKPANILVTKDPAGKVGLKVADFGIGGIAAGREIERSQTQVSRGGLSCSISHGSYTPLYASPEQVRGAPPDPRDDVHALGVIWFQLLTGDLSHGAPTGLDWIEDLETRGMSREQVGVLASCFSSKLERRPEDATALAGRIRSSCILGDEPRSGSPEVPPPTAMPSPPTTPPTSSSVRSGGMVPEERRDEPVAPSPGESPVNTPTRHEAVDRGGDAEQTAGDHASTVEWEEIREKLGLNPTWGQAVKEQIKVGFEGLGIAAMSDRSLSVNWEDRALVFTYGSVEILSLEHDEGFYQVGICRSSKDESRIDPRRVSEVHPIMGKSMVLVRLRTGRTPILESGDREGWMRGLAIVAASERGSTNPRRDRPGSLVGPWLQELCPTRREPARFTARGTLERFGTGQWNVLVQNAGEMVRFWEDHKVKTKLDWAGMLPPKATVGRKELLAICNAAGEGAEVEYDLEVQDRTNGRGVRGIALRVVGSRRAVGDEPA